MKTKYFVKTWLLAGFSALLLFSSCSEDDFITGSNLFPDDNKIIIGYASDSIPVKAYTRKQENFAFVSNSHSSLSLGYRYDDIFGGSRNDIVADFLFDASFSTPITTIDDSIYTDSGYVKFERKYKDSIAVLSVNLFTEFISSTGIPLSDTVDRDDANNFVNQEIEIYELLLDRNIEDLNGGYKTNSGIIGPYINVSDTFLLTYQPYRQWPSDSTRRIQKIKLPNDIGKRLLTDTIFEGQDTILPYNTDELFRKHLFNGLYFRPKDNNIDRKALSQMSMEATKIEVQYEYYSMVDGPILKDTALKTFSIDKSCNLFNHYLNEEQLGVKGESTLPENGVFKESVYIKGNYGLETVIVIDQLGKWFDADRYSINKASVILEFPEPYDSAKIQDADFLYPAYVNGYNYDNKTENNLVFYNGSSYSSLGYKENKDGLFTGYELIFTQELINLREEILEKYQADKANFSIDEELQSITLIVRPSYGTIDNRAMFNSPIHPEKPMKAIITYTLY